MFEDNEEPIRIMRVIARMNVGGPAVQISGLMRGLTGPKYDHRLYTGFVGTGEADYIETVAMDVSAIRVKGLGRKIHFFSDVIALISLIREIRKFKPQILHTHTAKAGVLGRIACVFSMQKVIRVHTFHGHLLNGYFGPISKFLVVCIEKVLALVSNRLLAVGNKVRLDLLQAGIGELKKFELMPPGLEISTLTDSAKSKSSLGLNANSLHCAFIGRVTQIKRPDRFLDVVREIKTRGLQLDFFIAGDGELLELCRKRIDEEALPVAILGWQSDIEKLLSAADIVLITSDNEGTPLCLIQAGMARIPVVSTNVGSVSDVVLDNVTGFLTDFDVDSIADALETLVLNSNLRKDFGEAGRTHTLDNFGLKKLVENHADLYSRLLSELS